MKEIIINKSRNYFRAILALIIVIGALYFSFKFLFYPSEHISFLFRTSETVVVFSIVGITSCFFATFIIIKSIFRKNAFLKIDKQGIYDGFSFYDNKFIKWEEISRIETIRHNYTNYIAIFTRGTLNKEKGINYLLYKINELSMGTPHIISSGYVDCSFEELKQIILESYNQNKENLKLSTQLRPRG